jgi:hypothetical protein
MELSEKIELYLNNQLNETEKSAFEAQMASDKSIQTEVNFQKQVQQGFEQYKLNTLKSNLQNIPISMESTAVSYTKWIIAGIAASALLIGTTLLITNQKEEVNQTSTDSKSNHVIQEQSTNNNTPECIGCNTSEETTKTETSNAIAVQNKNTSKKKTSNSKSNASVVSKSSTIEEPSFELDNQSNTSNDDVQVTDNYKPSNNNSTVVVSINKSNNKSMYYQFSGNKLNLFGDFSSSTYEIVELNNNGRKQLYLKFNNAYFELDQNKVTKTLLTEVNNEKTLQKLRIINQ